MTNVLATLIISAVLFIIWNNQPKLIELIGQFLVAHARAIHRRKELFEELTNGTIEKRP